MKTKYVLTDIDSYEKLLWFFEAPIALFLLIASVPLSIFLIFWIKIHSKGSAFFEQTRMGKNGKPFQMFKFRTMSHKMDPEEHKNFVLQQIQTDLFNRRKQIPLSFKDRRKTIFKLVTSRHSPLWSEWMRKWSLDEWPQLWNVVKGDMAFVGPRPPIPYEVEHYTEKQKKRLNVKPGITGLWQISGRSTMTYQEMVEVDLDYIQKKSFFTDIFIFIKTVLVVFFKSHWAH